MSFLSTVAWGLLGLVGALVAALGVIVLLVLTVPISVRASLSGEGAPAEAVAAWLFGLVRVELSLGRRERRWRLRFAGRVLLDRPFPEKEEEKEAGPEDGAAARPWPFRRRGAERPSGEAKARARRGRRASDRLRDLSPALFAAVWRGARRIVASLRLRIGGYLRFGLSDPADTGMLAGMLWAMKGAGQLGTLSFDTDFDGISFAGNAWASGEVHIGAIMRHVLGVLLAPPVRRFWMAETKAWLAGGRLGRLRDRLRPQARQVAIE